MTCPVCSKLFLCGLLAVGNVLLQLLAVVRSFR